jgi:hypothetical protein
MLNIFALYFLTYSRECKWLKDYIREIIWEKNCSSSISKQHFVDLIKNNE